MKNRQIFRNSVGTVLICAIFFNFLGLNGFAQQQPIVISFGQPNIWSLEQAHYLLARMHRTNLDLKTVTLPDLDPNETNSSRISIVKTLLDAGFKYDEAIGINNKLLKSDKTFNSGRRQELLTRRSSLQSESVQLSREISQLKSAKTKTSDQDEKIRLDAEIEAKTEEKAAVKEEISQVDEELKGMTSANGNFESVGTDSSGFDKTKLPDSALDAIIKEKAKDFAVNPTIASSQRLENHVQMQYEIIAKQLTLLRDEVGPGERLVFLELPQSINTSQGKADNKMAQVWWRIGGYTKINRQAIFSKEVENLKTQINKLKIADKINADEQNPLKNNLFDLTKQLADLEIVFNKLCDKKKEQQDSLKKLEAMVDSPDCQNKKKKLEISLKNLEFSIKETENALKETDEAIHANDDRQVRLQRENAKFSQMLTSLYTKYEKLKLQEVTFSMDKEQKTVDRLLQKGGEKNGDIVTKTREILRQNPAKYFVAGSENELNSGAERSFIDIESGASNSRGMNTSFLKNNAVRTIDIIPRQNAVNVNTTKETVKATGIVAAFSFLLGFGGKINYQRQSENLEQTLNQELYTSGFGKGSTDFGWNFYPFAGSKQIVPGVRNTYAVAIVPDDAETIVLKAKGCYFPRKEYQPLDYDSINTWETDKNVKKAGCTEREQSFIVPIPGASAEESDFYATGIRYDRNQKTERRMIASIEGENFSPQIGVLIDGVPLTEAVGLAQNAVESTVTDKVIKNCERRICGRFERIDSEQIIISFDVENDYNGTPSITLVAPGKAIELNGLYLNVNGRENTSISGSEYMFGTPTVASTISIDGFQTVSRSKGIITGDGFDKVKQFYVNGQDVKCLNEGISTNTLCIMDYAAGDSDSIAITLAPKDVDEPVITENYPNPFNLKINNASIIGFEAANKNNSPPVLTVRLDGAGFQDGLTIDLDATSNKRGAKIINKIFPSTGQMILEITNPGPIMQISLTDPNTQKSVTTVLSVPPPEPVKESSQEKK